MSTLNEKMTALADEVRELSGTTGSKSIDAMTTDIQDANSEVAEQADLIAQIATALAGKAAGGTALPSLSNPATAADILSGKEAIDGSGNKMIGTYTGGGGGSSATTATILIKLNVPLGPGDNGPTFYYTDGNMTLQTFTGVTGSFQMLANSIVAIDGWSGASECQGQGEQIFYTMSKSAYKIYGDCTMIYA
jgi:hypothetical protein